MKRLLVLCSGGNDSIALIQWCFENCPGKDFLVVYNDTKWARWDWPARIKTIQDMLEERGVYLVIIESEGMEELVRRKKGWPMPASKMQFCTRYLKESPTLQFLQENDQGRDVIVVTGRRREESENRARLPEYEKSTDKYAGRTVWNPLILVKEEERDSLIRRFGLDPLPHSSMECYPCVCSNKVDLGAIPKDDPKIAEIESIELSMGFTRNNKPRTMFRPYRVGGGVGIRQAIDWGHGPRGYKSEEIPERYRLKK